MLSQWPAERKIDLLRFRGKRGGAGPSSEGMKTGDEFELMELVQTMTKSYELLKTLTTNVNGYGEHRKEHLTNRKEHLTNRKYKELEKRLKSIKEDIDEFSSNIKYVKEQIDSAIEESEIRHATTDINVPGEKNTRNTLSQLVEKGRNLFAVQYGIYLEYLTEFQGLEEPKVFQPEKPVAEKGNPESMSVDEQKKQSKVEAGRGFDAHRHQLRKEHEAVG